MGHKWFTLQWRHNERDCILDHQPRDCLLNRLFKAQIKENIKAPRHCPLWGESPVTGEFSPKKASNGENVSIWWRHHGISSRQSPAVPLSIHVASGLSHALTRVPVTEM